MAINLLGNIHTIKPEHGLISRHSASLGTISTAAYLEMPSSTSRSWNLCMILNALFDFDSYPWFRVSRNVCIDLIVGCLMLSDRGEVALHSYRISCGNTVRV